MPGQNELPLDLAPVAPRTGRDELNLTEFPFAVLASRGSKESPLVIEFRDGEKEWVVQGSPKYGLPTSADVDLYVVLMELTREQSFPERVTFSRYELIERLGWDQHGRSYERLVTGLHRLRGISISAKNAFFDAQKRRWERERSIGIIAEFDITGSREAGTDEPALFPSWITWSPYLYRNMQAGYLKSLDVHLFLSLESSIAKALYRYLDAKRYDGKPLYRIGLRKLAFEHLGLSRNYYPSQIKRKLDPAHQELIDRGFLLATEYAEMRTQPGELMVIYRFPTRDGRLTLPDLVVEKTPAATPSPAPAPPSASASAPSPAPPSVPEEIQSRSRRLMEQGVSRKDALDLARSVPEECDRQLDYLPYRDAKNPGGVLVKSIREGWSAPPGWMQAQEAQARTERVRAREAEQATREEQQARAEAEFDQFWAGVDEAERTRLQAEAAAELRRENRMLAEFAGRHPDSPMYRAALRPLLKRLSGWQASQQGYGSVKE